MDKNSWFDREMRKGVDESSVDYSAVEARLFARISDAEELGALSILKMDEMLSIDKMEQMQSDLFTRVNQFVEYEEPVNECINLYQGLPHTQWERLESKLEKRLHDVSSLPEWEQLLMAPENEPTPGNWERLEDRLMGEIEKLENQEPWEQIARKEMISDPAAAEKAEDLLKLAIKDQQDKESWENVIRGEEIIPYRRWEKIEEDLFERIGSSSGFKTSRQPFWFVLEHYFSTLKTAGVVTAALLLAVAMVTGLVINNQKIRDLPTLVYELHGSAVNLLSLSVKVENQVSSTAGGAVTLVNSHGLVELQNESRLHLAKLSKKGAHYQVAFKEGENGGVSRGRVSFLVNPHRPDEEFKVYTPDYQIVVRGTYFRVEPDLAGKISTRVLEGAVKISSRLFGDTVLLAGQSIIYDAATNHYRIHNGGPVVQRKEIEQFPDVEDLLKYGTISIETNVSDAEVRIDGKYYGTAPLGLLQARGVHRVRVVHTGYHDFDTIVDLNSENASKLITVTLKPIEMPDEPVSKEPEIEGNREPEHKKESAVYPEQVAKMMLGTVDNVEQEKNTSKIYLDAQKAESSGKWRNAIKLYQQVFDDQKASRLRREDALFSVGKLKAEHEKSDISAKEVFLTYLALYPSGSFAGESWLRLAELEFRTNPENAIQYYLKYFEMFPRHPRISELQNRVGVIYLQQKRYDDAIAMFRQALSSQMTSGNNERKNVILNLHRALQEKGDIQTAQSVWKQYLAESDRNK